MADIIPIPFCLDFRIKEILTHSLYPKLFERLDKPGIFTEFKFQRDNYFPDRFTATTNYPLPDADGTRPAYIHKSRPHLLFQYNGDESLVGFDILHYIRCIRNNLDIGIDAALQSLSQMAQIELPNEWYNLSESQLENGRRERHEQFYDQMLREKSIWEIIKDFLDKNADGLLSISEAPKDIINGLMAFDHWKNEEINSRMINR